MPWRLLPAVTRCFHASVTGVRTRCIYAPEFLDVTAGTAEPTVEQGSVNVVGGLLQFNVLAVPGQNVAVMATTDLTSWVQVATHLFTTGTWTFSDPDTGLHERRFYKLVLLP